MWRPYPLRTLVITAAFIAASGAAADAASVTKASGWLGHVVVTRDGKEIGTVRDIGFDAHHTVSYVVVSVGSFLIENNLIAIAPDALVSLGAADGTLVLDADPATLKDAKRFAADGRWPAAPDVLRGTTGTLPSSAGSGATDAGAVPAATGASAPAPTGTATIESRSKSAHLSASERYIKEAQPSVTAAKPAAVPSPAAGPSAPLPAVPATAPARLEPITKFDRLDKDGDGVLNRSEFAPLMSPKDSYSKIDTNANGVIERQEYDAFELAHGQTD